MRVTNRLHLVVLGALAGACRPAAGPEAPSFEGEAEARQTAEVAQDERGEQAILETFEDEGFSDWDVDGDEVLSREEFSRGFANLFDDWDTDDDDILTERETQAGVWDMWDVNEDGVVSEGEWDDPWFEGTYAQFETWDIDDDEILTRTEFGRVWDGSGVWAAWDDDGDLLVSRDELESSIWAAWNLDDDATITRNEWAR